MPAASERVRAENDCGSNVGAFITRGRRTLDAIQPFLSFQNGRACGRMYEYIVEAALAVSLAQMTFATAGRVETSQTV